VATRASEITILRALAILAAFAAPAMASEPSLIGNWARGDGKTRIRVERCGPNYCAFNTWIKPGTKGEKVGDKLFVKVSSSGPSFMKAEGFDPQRNMTYSMRIEIGARAMTTHGCVLGGLMCRSMSWKRLST
jgi:uncharacterized protein (DUF2147 family)